MFFMSLAVIIVHLPRKNSGAQRGEPPPDVRGYWQVAAKAKIKGVGVTSVL